MIFRSPPCDPLALRRAPHQARPPETGHVVQTRPVLKAPFRAIGTKTTS